MIFNKKSILKTRPNSVDEEKCQDRQHIIRFTGNEANDVIYHFKILYFNLFNNNFSHRMIIPSNHILKK
jgi:hypothetical protein